MAEFKKGDRVRLSEAWLSHNNRENEGRGGAVVSSTTNGVTVMWDGLKSPQRFSPTFLELIPNDD